MIPKPKHWTPLGSYVVVAPSLSGYESAPLGRLFRSCVLHRFDSHPRGGVAPNISLDGSLAAGGYSIDIGAAGIRLVATDRAGLASAVYRLANMLQARNGRLVAPAGRLVDWPSTKWRGVHLFVGPTALDFHRKLWSRVLLPLGFNKAVLECERTEWKALPNLRGGINMPRKDLGRLFDWYRSEGVEPIPLVQSFGHMAWLFEGGHYRDLALNPGAPFAVDPRKSGTRDLLGNLWKEVVSVTRPKTVHFGFDEIDLRGWTGTASEMTGLWQTQLGLVGRLATSNSVKGMIWGDMALARGEGAGNTRAPDAASARMRRAAIPKEFAIADWHYLPRPDTDRFAASLKVWKGEGLRPIASSWFEPSNIYGFTQAALGEGCGTLQTTWAGYESSEAAMAANIPQFSAMVLAADYSWSGRSELPDRLGYDPLDVFRRMYFRVPRALHSLPGSFVLWGRAGGEVAVHGVRFRPQDFASLSAPIQLDVPLGRGRLWVLMAMEGGDRENEVVGGVELHYRDGSVGRTVIRYGQHVRAYFDSRPVLYSERDGRDFATPISVAKPLRSLLFLPGKRFDLRVLGATFVRGQGSHNNH